MENNNELNFSVQIPDDSNTCIRIYPGKKQRDFKGMEWVLVFIDMFQALAHDKELTLTDIRVLNGLLCHLDYGNIISITQTQLANELEIKQPNIATSIKKLIKKEYILIITQKGRQNIYSLNPHYGHKAKSAEKQMLDRAWDERKKTANETLKQNKDVS
jgi:DNA-binding MarR family transcriptional regulator